MQKIRTRLDKYVCDSMHSQQFCCVDVHLLYSRYHPTLWKLDFSLKSRSAYLEGKLPWRNSCV